MLVYVSQPFNVCLLDGLQDFFVVSLRTFYVIIQFVNLKSFAANMALFYVLTTGCKVKWQFRLQNVFATVLTDDLWVFTTLGDEKSLGILLLRSLISRDVLDSVIL